MSSLQEYFSSNETKSGLCKKLRECGFERSTSFSSPSYETDNAFVNIQKNSGQGILDGVPHEYIFILELSKPLHLFEADDPLFKFFKNLEQPTAHGISGNNPRHSIQEYLR